MILTFTPNPCVDKTLELNKLELGTKHRGVRMSCVAGGKGNNVSRAVRNLGGDTAALVVVAGHTGHHVVDMLENDDEVRCIPFWTAGLTRTINSIIEKDSGRQTVLFEPGPNLGDEEVLRLVQLFKDSLHGVQLVTLNGAVPCPSLKSVYAEMIKAAKSVGVPVLLDSYGEELLLGLEAEPKIVKLNREEAAQALGMRLDSQEALLDAISRVQSAGCEIAIITHGADAVYVGWDDQRFRVTPPTVEEVNPVGSGDVFAGALGVAMLRGRTPEDCFRHAAAAGAANAKTWAIGHFDLKALCALEAETKVEAL